MLSGTTITVDTNSDTNSDGTTLRNAVTQANSENNGDTIVFASSLAGETITLTQGQLVLTGSMTITGLGANQLTIDGGKASQIFDIDGTTAQQVTITGLTLQHGSDTSGSGGGAIYNSATLTLANDAIISNVTTSTGGGIENIGTLTASNDTIANNTASYGAGIENDDGTLTLSNDAISGNSASHYAGGIENYAQLTSMNDTISGNSGNAGTGGITNYGTLTSTDDTISGNTANNGTGGGVYNEGALTTTDDSITGNFSTMSNGGAGVYNIKTFNAINTVIVGNADAITANSVTTYTEDDVHGGINSGSNNLTSYTTGQTLASVLQTSGAGPTGFNPLLASNGGTTQTIALVAGSPAIGAGAALTTLSAAVTSTTAMTITVNDATYLAVGDDLKLGNEVMAVTTINGTTVTVARAQFGTTAATYSSGVSVYLATDQTGLLRSGNDLGARASQHALSVSTITDAVAESGQTTLREAIAVANADVNAQTITFASSLAGQTIKLAQGELLLTGSMTITGLGNNQLTIDGNNASRIFDITGTTAQQVTITGLTLQHGNDTSGNGGGAIYNGATMTLAYDTIANNTAYIGGSIENIGTLTASNVTIANNTASYGGGIENDLGTLTLSNDMISGNSVSGYAGGILNTGTLTSMNDTISGNSGNAGTGGITTSGTLTSTDDTISGNTAANGTGGGVFNEGTLTTTNDTIAGNFSTISNGGGGVLNLVTFNAINTVIVGNADAVTSNSVTTYTEDDVQGKIASGSNNLTSYATGQTLASVLQMSGAGPTGFNPLLASNGGVNQTIALAPGSSNPALTAGAALTSVTSNGDGGTTLTVNSTTFIAAGDALQIGTEIVLVTGVQNSTTVSVQRAQAGTSQENLDGQQVFLAYDQRGVARTEDQAGIGAFVRGTSTSLVVNSKSDTDAAGTTTLRDAIAQANQDVLGDTITFASNLADATIKLTQGELLLAGSMTITGLGANQLTIDGNNASLIFDIPGTTAQQVTITGLTLQHGNDSSGFGGAIYNNAVLTLANATIADNTALVGGGIANDDAGTLTLSNDTFSGNSVSAYAGGIFNNGTLTSMNDTISGNLGNTGTGGITNFGTLTSTNDTISGNTAANGDGSGVFNEGTLTSTNDTISGNTAANGTGGGVFNEGTLTTTNDTIAGNFSTISNGGGGVLNLVTFNAINTVIVGNADAVTSNSVTTYTEDDVQGGITSGSNNLTSYATGQTLASVLQTSSAGPTGFNPLLASNGGTTQTIALVAGSPAIGTGAALTTLSAAVTSTTATTIGVNDATYLAVGDDLKLGNEVMEVTAINGTNITVARAQFGTTPATYSSGISVYLAADQTGLLRSGNDLGARASQHALSVSTATDAVADSGQTTLREAIAVANADVNAETITFASGLSGRTIKLAQGELLLTGSMTIAGLGANQLTIDGADASRIFDITGTTSQQVAITGLTLQHGKDTSGSGGGAIYNSATLTLANDALTSNITSANGGAVENNSGAVTSAGDTYAGNWATHGSGGIDNESGEFTSTNDTIASNSTPGVGGGGVGNYFGTFTSTNDTIANNSSTAQPYGGGIDNYGATWNSLNTIVAANPAGGDVYSVGTINASNTLIGDTSITAADISSGSGNIFDPTNQNIFVTGGGHPLLASNGGTTQTIELIAGSPAIGSGAALTTLAAGVNSTTAMTITVNSAGRLAVGDELKIGTEIMAVSAINGTTVTVARAQLGTTATTHPTVGTAIYLATDQAGFLRTTNDLGARAALVPTITAPATASLNAGSSLNFSGANAITVTDNNGTTEKLTLAVSHGTLSLANTTGVTITGGGTATLTITGSSSSLNSDLTSLTYSPVSYFGSDKLTLTDMDTTDNLAGTASVALTVTAVAPTIKAPASVGLNQNASLIFSGANAIGVTDPSGTAEELVLSVVDGTLTLGTLTGLTVTGSGTVSMTLTGSLASLNSDLPSLKFTPTAGYHGSSTLKLFSKDTADGLSASGSVAMTIIGPPTITAPGKVTVTADSGVAFTGSNAITVADLGGTAEELVLTVAHGILTLGMTTGLTVTGSGTVSMMITGSLTNLNTDLASLTYNPTAGYGGSDTLKMFSKDTTDGLSSSSSIGLSIVAQPPTVTAPATANLNQGGNLTFAGANAITVADPTGTAEELVLSVAHGTLALGLTTGLTVTGSGSASIKIIGAISNLNNDLASLTYTPTAGYHGSDKLSYWNKDTTDGLSVSGTMALTVNPLAPTFSAPATASVTHGSSLAFTGANAISVTDQSGTAEDLVLTVTHGTLMLQTITGLTVTANGTASLTITGSLASLNSDLPSLVYTPNAGYVGSDTLKLWNKDTSDSLSVSASVALTVS